MTKTSVIQVMIELRNSMFLIKEVYTLSEVCTYTGYEKSYIHRLCSQRKIPHYKSPSGKEVFFDKNELVAWLKSCQVPMNKKINPEPNDLLDKMLENLNRKN